MRGQEGFVSEVFFEERELAGSSYPGIVREATELLSKSTWYASND